MASTYEIVYPVSKETAQIFLNAFISICGTDA
jgi:hypothetical protein